MIRATKIMQQMIKIVYPESELLYFNIPRLESTPRATMAKMEKIMKKTPTTKVE